MPDSIHKQIIAQIEALLTPLKDAGTVRELAVRNSTEHGAKALPALHIVPGTEQRIGEDNRGYTLQRDYVLKLVFGKTREPFDKAADLVAAVQEAIEEDLQLGGLADQILYEGEDPFITDDAGGVEGTLVIYRVQYRRPRATPAETY